MDVVINNNLRLELNESVLNLLHIKLDDQLDRLQLEYLINQIRYQVRQFDLSKFIIEIKELHASYIPLIRSVLSTPNKTKRKVGFLIDTVDDVNHLYALRDLLKENHPCVTRIFMSIDSSKEWLRNPKAVVDNVLKKVI